jgi:upstream activation factor subunit UAF30
VADRRVTSKQSRAARRVPTRQAAPKRPAAASATSAVAVKGTTTSRPTAEGKVPPRARTQVAPAPTVARAAKSTACKGPAAKDPGTRPVPARVRLRPKAGAMPQLVKPQQPDSALAELVGNTPLPRTQAIRRIWSYIRTNGLQDTQNRRMINADERLRRIFGNQKQVSMYEMASLMNRHLSRV